jgi:hypothetical protein
LSWAPGPPAERGYYDHLDRDRAQFEARQQADYLWDQQYGQQQYGQY